MKRLPDDPHLEHLRGQAKALLAGLRDTDPDATLGRAQAALAQQYGFRTWVDLKAEVELRAGRADVAEPALARAISAAFGLGDPDEMRSAASPDELGRAWSLRTSAGRFTARTVDTLYPPSDGELDVALQEAAARAGVLLPAPVRSVAGRVVETIEGHLWRVHTWLPAGPPLSAPAGVAVTEQVGAALALVHGLALPPAQLSPWHCMLFSDRAWSTLAADAAAAGAPWATALAAAVPALDDLARVGADAPVPDPVLCMNNLVPAGARLDGGGRLVVTGWEHADGQPPAWELASALVWWTVRADGEVDEPAARGLVDGYRAVTGAVPRLELATFRGAATSASNYLAGQVAMALDAPGTADRDVAHGLAHLTTRATFERVLAAIG